MHDLLLELLLKSGYQAGITYNHQISTPLFLTTTEFQQAFCLLNYVINSLG